MEVMILSCYNPANKRSDMSGMFTVKRRTHFRERLSGLPVVARAREYLDVIRVQTYSNLCTGTMSTDKDDEARGTTDDCGQR